MKLRDKTDEDIEADLLPFGFMDDGHDPEEVIDLVETPNSEYRNMFF